MPIGRPRSSVGGAGAGAGGVRQPSGVRSAVTAATRGSDTSRCPAPAPAAGNPPTVVVTVGDRNRARFVLPGERQYAGVVATGGDIGSIR